MRSILKRLRLEWAVFRWLTLGVIVGALPNNIQNGQTEDAVPVMANYNWIVNQVNANAAALAGGNAFTGNQTINGTLSTTGTVSIGTAGVPITGTSVGISIGATPSAWVSGRAVEAGFVGVGIWGAGATNTVFASNYIQDSGGEKFASNGFASYFNLNNGLASWIVSSATGLAGAAATMVTRMSLAADGGLQLGAPTGGSKGAGTANFAADIYKNNTAYTNPDYVFEYAFTGKIEKFADKEGAAQYTGKLSLAALEVYARDHLCLPGFGQEAGHGAFSGADMLLARLEEAYLHIFDLNKRLAAIEKRGG